MSKVRTDFGYTPYNTRLMGNKELRRTYAELRKIAQKRAQRMRASGYGSYDLANPNFPMTKSLSNDEVRVALLDVASYLREPRTTLRSLRAIESKQLETLREHGYQIENLGEFGNYMDAMRERFKGRIIPPSDDIAEVFQEAERLGMSGKTLLRHFTKWLDDREGAASLAEAMSKMQLPEGRKRITSTELKYMLER